MLIKKRLLAPASPINYFLRNDEGSMWTFPMCFSPAVNPCFQSKFNQWGAVNSINFLVRCPFLWRCPLLCFFLAHPSYIFLSVSFYESLELRFLWGATRQPSDPPLMRCLVGRLLQNFLFIHLKLFVVALLVLESGVCNASKYQIFIRSHRNLPKYGIGLKSATWPRGSR